MNKKLSHRLELSKEQVHNFVSYLYELKNEHMIINEEVIEILSKIRENLLGGKVMKNNDLEAILSKYKQSDLDAPSTAKIIARLRAMMIWIWIKYWKLSKNSIPVDVDRLSLAATFV